MWNCWAPLCSIPSCWNTRQSPTASTTSSPGSERFRHSCERRNASFAACRQIWIQVAKEENDGNIDLIDKTLREGVPAPQKQAYDQAAKPALDALREFNRFLENDLPKRSTKMAPSRTGVSAPTITRRNSS